MFATRKIAICISSWNRDGALYSWAYVKQYILRTRDWHGRGPVLDEGDLIFIVHVGSPKGSSNNRKSDWKAGGPLTRSLEESLQSYPHKIVELTGSAVMGTFLEWAEVNNIDFLVLGFHEKPLKGGVSKMVPGEWGLASTSSRALQHTRVPLLVVRPDAALKLSRLRIQANEDVVAAAPVLPRVSEHAGESEIAELPDVPRLRRTLSPSRQSSATSQDGRRIGLAFEHKSAGRALLAWASKKVLRGSDTVFVCQVSPSRHKDGQSSDKDNGVKAEPLSPRSEEGEVGDPCAELLFGFNVAVRQQQQGDPRDRFTAFAWEHNLELLVVGRSPGSRFRKAFTPGGTVSQHVVSNAICPVLVFLQKVAEEEPRQAASLPDQSVRPSELSQAISVAAAKSATATSSSRRALDESNGEAATLRRQVKDRDFEISILKNHVAHLQAQLALQSTGAKPSGGHGATQAVGNRAMPDETSDQTV